MSGTITKINHNFECGFVKVKGMKDVFFNRKTDFGTVTLSDLKIGDNVKIIFEETSRGPLAKTLFLSPKTVRRTEKRPLEAGL